ncbi:aldo/keto reductase [Planomonospora venezuelensis]|uniref:Aryl-alcohol dehydrogenase-like predicted oxidoreductase n=1 Tax=Planomonospora venezuelensis TaxID=1999 RepID=A0A841DBC3_PLAVE|nr:aldo/keto reductase [Planomonospora venezuelensis]MBB5967952.1 aryl-alcohol dehydrogenase-like predicted oxidoreductase [Planomonospora venezuelensis]GIN03319.1 NADP-dependent aryl-alcohol dehydrogenase [Planomonospora venezuelensis]
MSFSELNLFPLCLGGNVFGWTADRETSFAILDAYAEAGGNFVDTADSYSHWVPGHAGGESETIIGEWMASRRNRDRVVVATKVGMLPARSGLSPANIRVSVEGSLRRLGTDHIDLYWAHIDDAETPLEETLGTFDALIREGKIRNIGASNHEAGRLAEALEVSERDGLARYGVVQQHYNLVERGYEGALRDVVAGAGLTSTPYFGLARGFLTGKYRPGVEVDSPRAGKASEYLATERGPRVLDALEKVAAAHGAVPATIALAWLAAQPTVAAPIASARDVEQLRPLLAVAEVELTEDELALLDEASR